MTTTGLGFGGNLGLLPPLNPGQPPAQLPDYIPEDDVFIDDVQTQRQRFEQSERLAGNVNVRGSDFNEPTTPPASSDFWTGMTMAAGAAMQAVGSYHAEQNMKRRDEAAASTREFEATLSDINANQAEHRMTSMLAAGRRAASLVRLAKGRETGEIRAAAGASGTTVGKGSTVQVQASNEVLREIEALTITGNALRSAAGASAQATNLRSNATLQRVSANNLRIGAASRSPLLAGITSLTSSGTAIAGQLLRDRSIAEYMRRTS